MKTRDYEGIEVRKILTGMVLDKVVCARVASQWHAGGLFAANWANIVGDMTVKHFKKYEKPPGGQLRMLFEEWAMSPAVSDEMIVAVERFLQALPDTMDDPPDYILDLAGRHFNRVNMNLALAEIKRDLENNLNEDALERIQNFKRVNLGVGSYSEPLKSIALWEAAADQERHAPLVTYRGELEKFFNGVFQRHKFISFMGPEKAGKTWWLIDMVYRALRQKRRVAWFDLGDGDQEDFLGRLACRISSQPLWPSDVTLPEANPQSSCTWGGVDGGEELEFSTAKEEAVDLLAAFREINRLSGADDRLRTSYHAASTLDVEEFDTILHEWDRGEDWRPDVVVLDYADLFAPPPGYKEENSQIDYTWKVLHRVAKKRHCLVVTATQVNASSYGKEDGLLSKKHFSGRKTKLAHVDAMLGINVTPEEREKGLSRINFVVRRKGAYNEKRFVRVAGCLAIGNPAILSKKM